MTVKTRFDPGDYFDVSYSRGAVPTPDPIPPSTHDVPPPDPCVADE